MNTTLQMGIVAILVTTQPAFSGEDLLEAHLSQARGLKNDTAPTATIAFKKTKREIEERLEKWKTRLELRDGEADLIAGIPSATMELARGAADEAAKARELIKSKATLNMFLALAATRNPDARAAFQNWRAMLRQFEQASYLEDLVIQYRAFVRELDTGVGPQTHKEMPSATFPFPAALALKGQMVDLDADVSRLAYLQALKSAMNQTANEFFEVQGMTHELALMKLSRDLYEQVVKSTRSQLESGKAMQADLLKAQSQLATLDDQVEILKHHRQHHINQVNILMGLPPNSEWGTLAETDLTNSEESSAFETAHLQNQELLKSQREAELQEVMVRMAETMIYPRGSAGMSQLALSTGAEAGTTRSEMAAFPVRPTPDREQATFGPNAAYIDELRVRIRETREKVGAMIAKLDFMVDHANFTLHVAQRNQKTYTNVVVPKAKSTFELAKKHTSYGESSLGELLESGRMYLDAEKMLNDYRRDRNKGLVDYQDAQGRTAANLMVKKVALEQEPKP